MGTNGAVHKTLHLELIYLRNSTRHVSSFDISKTQGKMETIVKNVGQVANLRADFQSAQTARVNKPAPEKIGSLNFPLSSFVNRYTGFLL